MKKLMFLSCACAALFFASCSGNKSSNSSESSADSTAVDSSASTAAAPEQNSTATIPGLDSMKANNSISFSGDDQMKYSATLFKVKAADQITLTFKNAGKLPATAMSHDVVILKAGSDVTAFGNAVAQAKDHDIKNMTPDMQAEVIASTKMLGPGQSDKITFKVPAAGTYPFLCTFPGHFMTMQGKIVAE